MQNPSRFLWFFFLLSFFLGTPWNFSKRLTFPKYLGFLGIFHWFTQQLFRAITGASIANRLGNIHSLFLRSMPLKRPPRSVCVHCVWPPGHGHRRKRGLPIRPANLWSDDIWEYLLSTHLCVWLFRLTVWFCYSILNSGGPAPPKGKSLSRWYFRQCLQPRCPTRLGRWLPSSAVQPREQLGKFQMGPIEVHGGTGMFLIISVSHHVARDEHWYIFVESINGQNMKDGTKAINAVADQSQGDPFRLSPPTFFRFAKCSRIRWPRTYDLTSKLFQVGYSTHRWDTLLICIST